MHSAQTTLRDVTIDVQFELLAAGVERLVDETFGIPVTPYAAQPQARTGHAATPDLLIADFSGEIEQTEQRINGLLSRARAFSLLVIMLVRWDDVAIRFVRSGARGIIYPNASAADFIEAITTVADRQTYLPPSLQRTLAQRYVGGADSSIDRLTRRELEFVRKLAQGMSTSEIATDLGVSPKTADTHRANLLRKLGIRNNVDVARLALRHGLVPL